MPYYIEPYSNLNHELPINGSQLKSEISARTLIKAEVVDIVLKTLKEVAAEEIVNKGAFNFAGLFAVRNYSTKETVTPKGVIPARLRLSVRLNDRVKKLWNFKMKAGITEALTFDELMDGYSKANRKVSFDEALSEILDGGDDEL